MLKDKPFIYQIFDRAILLFWGLLFISPCVICYYAQIWPVVAPANNPGRRICQNLKQSEDLAHTATCWERGLVRDYIHLYFPVDESSLSKVERGMADFILVSEGTCHHPAGSCYSVTYKMHDTFLLDYVTFYFVNDRLFDIDVEDG